MSYKTIVICLNEIARVPQLIAAAKELGTRFKAHVSGLYVTPGAQTYPTSEFGSLANIYDGNREYFQTNLPKVKKDFETAMQREGLSFDFQEIDSETPNVANDVIKQCRAADLVVVSSTNRKDYTGVEHDFVERFVIASGRPVLILPLNVDTKFTYNEILLGWDDSREASRAAFDALPFLESAKSVRIVTIDGTPRGTIPGADIAQNLDRHGVKTEITTMAPDGMGNGEALMQAANDYGASLIVMGAYGHSRFTEFIFGGTTRHVILNMDRPVLMSH